jgi:hypothetical protein
MVLPDGLLPDGLLPDGVEPDGVEPDRLLRAGPEVRRTLLGVRKPV